MLDNLSDQQVAVNNSREIVRDLSSTLAKMERFVKRTEDLFLGSIVLLVLLPIFIIIAVAIKVESRGPVLFWQRRSGLNGTPIWICKFRSMYTGLPDEPSEVQTRRGDVRVTRVGRIIRKHSLDELPQLFNVLTGTMSLVGPRPHALLTSINGHPVERLVDFYAHRGRTKPGITGWAQINGWRGELDAIEKLTKRVAHDLYYITNWSLMLDLRILARTAMCVIRDENAF